MKPFCAVCLAYVTGAVHREPIGLNDALVVVCRTCSTMPIRNAQPYRDPVSVYRRRLIEEGYCANGREHARPAEGQLCEACRARYRARDARRRKAAHGA